MDARQTCAQLLLLLLAKERGRGYPSVRSAALSDLYHENTEFDPRGRTALLFEQLLADTEKVVLLRPQSQGRKAVRKSRIFSLFLFMRLLRFSPINIARSIEPIANLFWSEEAADEEPLGRIASAETLEKHFIWFTERRMKALSLPELDRQRLFSAEQKRELYLKYQGKCGICTEPVSEGWAEYDHIKPWILGGHTHIENGRPVHPECHARGLAAVGGSEAPVDTQTLTA